MKKIIISLFFFCMLCFPLLPGSTSCAQKNLTVSPKTTIKTGYRKSVSWNKYTKHYFVLRTYLERIEKKGGGVLTLKKGTYKLSNTLYVPSNVTIKFKDGVKIVKLNKCGKGELKPAETIFHVVDSKIGRTNKKAYGYNGAKNVKFIGEGNVTIDLKYIKEGKAILTAHCQDVEISGIRFLHMNVGHFLEIDATKNLTVRNCTFSGVSKNTPYTKEAINLDTPDPLTGGLGISWSSLDRTPNQDVLIENCRFTNLKRGIGTHKYSQRKVNGQWAENCYHENITIRNNTFTDIKNTGIFMLNWKNVTCADNSFVKNALCVNFRGVQQPFVFSHNTFTNSTVTQTFTGDKKNLYYMGYKSPGKGGEYSPIYNDMGVTTLYELLALNNA
ncbi:MAG: right-handed parallel beta-helix repeat-containing protein [Lachnospiraceae bacterium]|nr:right-handed parallel beta-helix repeat-containing protein [Lachnospiraceae bacterium]